jgi:hypothetical protein
MKPARRVALAPEVFWNSRVFLVTRAPGADATRLAGRFESVCGAE